MPPDFDRLRVVLVETRNPLNIGAAARAMSNFEFLRLRVVNPYHVAFREARSAVGSSTATEGRRRVHQRGRRGRRLHARRRHHCGSASRAATHIAASGARSTASFAKRSQRSRSSAVRVGENRPLERRSQPLPLADAHSHAQAASVDEPRSGGCRVPVRDLARHEEVSGKKDKPEKRAKAGEVERISTVLLESLHRSGYVKTNAVTSTEERVRRMVRRLDLSSDDAELWLGMFRQMLWKIKNGTAQ